MTKTKPSKHGKSLQDSSQNSQAINQFRCFGRYSYTPCYQNSDPLSLYVGLGSDIFVSKTDPTIQNFATSGWIYLLGDQSQNYNILTVLQGSQILFSVQYNIPGNYFSVQLNSDSAANMVYQNPGIIAIIQQQWYFFQFYMEVTAGSQLNLNTYIFEQNQNYFILQLSKPGIGFNSFKAADLVFDFGKGQSSVYSCLFLHYVYIYWDLKLNNPNSFSLFEDISAYDIYLKQNYDTTYTQQNNGYLIQVNLPNGKLPLQINQKDHFVLKNQEQIKTDFINFKSQRSFVLSFHFRLVPQSGNSNPISIMYLTSQNNYQIQVSNNNLYFINNLVNGFQLNQWNQITLIYREFYYLTLQLILNDDLANSIVINLNSKLIASQATFGDSSITNYFLYLNYIRIYEGGFLSQTNSCFMLAARNDQQCIICRSGYLLDYQNNMTCVTPSSSNQSTLINNVKDWTPKQFTCPKNMILDSQDICKCFFQFYRRGDECFQCQSYCKGCIDANTCIEMDSQRQSNGICKTGYFDDGYTCIKPMFNIKSRINYKINLSQSDLGAGCSQEGTQSSYITHNSVLKIQKERGFFFCFVFSAHNTTPQSTIAFIQDGGLELFTIMFEMNNNNGYSMPSFSLYVLGVKQQILFSSQTNSVWIAFQTDFSTAYFHIFFYLNLYTAVIDVKSQFSSYTVNDPFLCIGKCSSQFQPSYVCANYDQLYYIYQLDQLGDYSQIKNLIQFQTNQIAFFKLDYSNLPTSNYIIDPISSLKLQSNINLIIKRFKGIQFTQNINALIQGLILNSIYPTFSCNIFIEKLTMETRGQIQQKIFEEFEIFCNYQREVIQFNNPPLPDNNPKTALIFYQVNQLNLQDQSLYINKIRIEIGQGSYYYDYDNSEKCFLFRNILQMECLIPKKGFVFYSNNQIISEDECNKMTSILKLFHTIDSSAYECVDTRLSPDCIMLDDSSQNFMCIKCQYSGQDPIIDTFMLKMQPKLLDLYQYF
ncbi:bowman-birk serine protease inhibitor family protein (macronuclear) [Tetrahymena thermophila SB210]|uniref:Bowman-birk serine protease inhibitor family protein n=1 Tax=Tetrahymena thermophila (strain SB210) TaxID=312017 RepID=Q24F31_TETTS|nr:bowman-birk serine protease inhibitor family protein [Tetrahymena thermophila SB210]EAS06376.2 bowman-birk serine protease inhibitor family protein [Tetrahymena thermophila SB210]|eukprot:XP_001026621.2 bowman-birk serine protease inhibitor family protein [Tetrahymena thermophila SB210]